MKKQKYDAYSKYYYKQNKKGKTKTKIFTILFCLISVIVVAFFSISFSNVLTISKIVNVNSNYIYTNKILYALSLYSTKQIDEANIYSENIKKQGGAGFIYFVDDNYNVISSIYMNINDAKTVKTNLSDSGIECSIIKIEMPAININATLSTKSSNIISESINLFYNNYEKLYKLSVEFDKQKIDILKVKSSMGELYTNNSEIIEKYNNYFNQSTNVYILYIKIYLTKLNNIIKTYENLDDTANISSFIKETYCKIISCYQNLYNEMV